MLSKETITNRQTHRHFLLYWFNTRQRNYSGLDTDSRGPDDNSQRLTKLIRRIIYIYVGQNN